MWIRPPCSIRTPGLPLSVSTNNAMPQPGPAWRSPPIAMTRLGTLRLDSQLALRHKTGVISKPITCGFAYCESRLRVETLFALSWILTGIGMYCLTTGAIWSMGRDTVGLAHPEDLGRHVLGGMHPVEQEEQHAVAQVEREPAPGLDCAPAGPPLESLSLSASGCTFSTFANSKLNSWRDMPMRVLKRLAFPDSLVYDSM